MSERTTANKQLVYGDLSYEVVGASLRVLNELGGGLSEKQYQSAFAKELELAKIPFKREVYIYIPLKYRSEKVGGYFVGFIVDSKIVTELKVVRKLGYAHTKQVLGYLKSFGLKLGIVLYFTPDGVKYRRVLNFLV